ncbi:Transmembrane protein [Globisporangium polare]
MAVRHSQQQHGDDDVIGIGSAYETHTIDGGGAVPTDRTRAQSEAIAMMESPTDADSIWAPLSDFHGELLDSTRNAAGGAASLLGAPPLPPTYTAASSAVDSKLAREIDRYKMAGQSSRRGLFSASRAGIGGAIGSGRSLTRASGAAGNGDGADGSSGGEKQKAADGETTLLNRKHVGLVVSVALASLLSTWLKRGVLELMQRQLEMQQYQVDAAELLLLLPWSCSFVLGFCSDIFPVFGSHRKAYMIFGWVLSAVALATMAILNHSNDFHSALWSQNTSNNSSASTENGENDKAAIVGGYVFLLGAACFGVILSIMMAEIYVIAFSKRESIEQRGHLVGTFLLVQFGAQVVGQTVTDAVVFNMAADGTTLKPYISFQDTILFLSVYSLLPIPIVLFFFDDRLADDYDAAMASSIFAATRTSSQAGNDSILCISQEDECELLQESKPPGHPYPQGPGLKNRLVAIFHQTKNHWQLLWTALEEKATWQIVCFLCVFIFFSEFTLRYPFLVLDQWAHVTDKIVSTGKIFTEVMFFLAVLLWKGLCVNTKWGTFVIVSYLGVFIFPPMTFFLLVTFGIGTNLELYIFVSQFQGFIRALAVVLEVVMMIEIAPRGGEGAVLGTVVSIATIMRLISQTFSNFIGYLFGTQLLMSSRGDANAADSPTSNDEPMLVATALLLCYTLRLFALLGVVFLPSQKRALRALQLVGGRKGFRAWWTLGVLIIALLLGTLINSLVITPETTCLHALGGSGCD